MIDGFSKTFRERAGKWAAQQKYMPKRLQAVFEAAAQPEEIYPLRQVSLCREDWRKSWVTTYTKTIGPNGAQALIPTLADPIIFGELNESSRDEFLHNVALYKQFMPDFLRTILAERGVKITVAQIMSHIDPAYETRKARGQDGVMENTHGCYSPYKKSVHVTQGYILPGQEERIYTEIPDYEIISTLLHEFGHAVEDIVFPTYRHVFRARDGNQYRDFLHAYRKDVAALEGRTTSICGRDLTYYLEKKHGGTQEREAHAISEIFAEIFSETYEDCSIDTRRSFSETTKVFEKIMESLRQLIEKEPHIGVLAVNDIPELTSVVPKWEYAVA
jgi:hypothetical protein